MIHMEQKGIHHFSLYSRKHNSTFRQYDLDEWTNLTYTVFTVRIDIYPRLGKEENGAFRTD